LLARVAVALLGAAIGSAPHNVAAGTVSPAPTGVLLDVPYLPQTPELCGGAAVAMVLRYWGEGDVFPQDFASLVGTGTGGILTSALASAVRDRGWQAFVLPGAADDSGARLQSELDRGRPLIALIEVGRATYHYVVVVASTGRAVVVHDPARAPFRVMQPAEFDRAWAAAGRWSMLVLPPDEDRPVDGVPRPHGDPSAEAVRGVSGVHTSCSGLVDHGVAQARTGDLDGAEASLTVATSLCPAAAAPWRELSGLRFAQSRWTEAETHALAAVHLAPDDAHAWQLVAASRYLSGDTMGALDAWNRAGDPRIDTIVLRGVERTPQPVVVRATGWQPREVLTPEVFGHGLRRLRALPVASGARIRYEPRFPDTGGSVANIDVFIDERPRAPQGWLPLATLGVRALLFDEAVVDVAGTLGAGEVVTGAWRWSTGRPRVALGLAMPSPRWFPGVIAIDGSWERQSYATVPPGDATLTREERRRVALRLADWSSSRLWWQAGLALDRLEQRQNSAAETFAAWDYVAIEGALDLRRLGDRVAIAATGGWWGPLDGGASFSSGGLLAAWRSSREPALPVWSARTTVAVVSRTAPLALWPGAGTGRGRSGLLRAHPLIRGGAITGPAFGRGVLNGSLEYARPIGRTLGRGLAVAGFVDAGRAWNRPEGRGASRLFVDAGVGVRAPAPGHDARFRIDLAHGLRGGGFTLSANWGMAWPR
jgi:hypothetical protein